MKIPARYENVKIEDVPVEIFDSFKKICLEGRGIYLYGGVGSGKTHIVWALATEGYKHKIEREATLNKEAEERGEKVRYVVDSYECEIINTTELLREIKSEFDKPNESFDTLAWILGKDRGSFASTKKILILDDVGSEKLSEWVRETFYQIINNRNENKKPFMITSNFSIQQLAERIGDRNVSRIVEMCDIFELKGDDRRMENPKKIEIR